MSKGFKANVIERAKSVSSFVLPRLASLVLLLSKIEPTDASFLLGLVMLHDGLRRTFDVGIANIIVGTVLVAVPLILIIRSQPTKKA